MSVCKFCFFHKNLLKFIASAYNMENEKQNLVTEVFAE